MKKTFSLATSIISLFILQFSFLVNSNSQDNNSKYYSNDSGILSILYHRFNENKYPSTNIQLDVFKEQLEIIEKEGIEFIHPKNFKKSLTEKKNQRKSFFPFIWWCS